MISQGFLGYGTVALLVVLGVVTSFYRPRWKLWIAWSALVYLGLSFYVTYMRDRGDIRTAVWGGAPISTRLSLVVGLATNVELFSLGNREQAERIDVRLNQNRLVGMAAEYLDMGRVDFARGSTIFELLYAVIPRALWPGKPMTGGSGDIVTRYTGVYFAEGTSVGVGHVLEFYVNFGLWAVFVGFAGLGWLLMWADETAGTALRNSQFITYFRVFVPAVSVLQVGGSLRETMVAVIAGWLGVSGAIAVLRRLGHRATLAEPSRANRPQIRPLPRST
jgi:hypothetical protein